MRVALSFWDRALLEGLLHRQNVGVVHEQKNQNEESSDRERKQDSAKRRERGSFVFPASSHQLPRLLLKTGSDCHSKRNAGDHE